MEYYNVCTIHVQCVDHSVLQRDPPISRGRATGLAAGRGRLLLEQSRQPTAPKQIKAVRFYYSLPPKPHDHQRGHDFVKKFDHCAVSLSVVPPWGFEAAPAQLGDPKSDTHPASACNFFSDSPGAPGRTGAVDRRVGCQLVFLDLCALVEF